MEFMTAILSRLQEDGDASLSAIVSDVYGATLQRYHGWIVSSTFSVGGGGVCCRAVGWWRCFGAWGCVCKRGSGSGRARKTSTKPTRCSRKTTNGRVQV